MTSRNPAAVLFDMDGTLVDSEGLWSIAIDDRARALGGTLSQRARDAMVGSSMPTSMRLLLDDLGVPVTDHAIAEAGQAVAARTAELFAEGLRWRPGARETLHAVRVAGIPTALVTSTVRPLTEIALDTLGRQHFDATVCGDEVDGQHKPHPEPYLRACTLLDVKPVECLAIEDSPSGVASALAAGCTVLAVPHAVPLQAGERRILRDTLVGLDVHTLGALLP